MSMYTPDKQRFAFNHRQLLEDVLDSIGVDRDSICLDMSVPLYHAGIRENGDVDIIIDPNKRPTALREARRRDDCWVTEDEKIVFQDDIEFVQPGRYEKFGIPDRQLVQNEAYHKTVEGYKMARLELVLSLKYAQSRPKDMDDIRLIEQTDIIGGEQWDWELVSVVPPWDRTHSDSGLIPLRAVQLFRDEGLYSTITEGIEFINRQLNLDSAVEDSLDTVRSLSPGHGLRRLHDRGLQCHVPVSNIAGSYYKNDTFTGWHLVLASAARSQRVEFVTADTLAGETKFDITESASPGDDVVLNEDMKLLSGIETVADRFVHAPEETVEVSISSETPESDYDRRWLRTVGFDPDEIRQLETFRDERLEDAGVYFYAFLWPSAYELRDEIQSYVSERVDIKQTYELPLSEGFEQFVWDLYSIDEDIRRWVIQKKIRACKRKSNPVQVLVVELTRPEFEYGDTPASATAASLKEACRKEFYTDVGEYVFDNIIHITDNYRQNRHAKNTVSSYARRTQ